MFYRDTGGAGDVGSATGRVMYPISAITHQVHHSAPPDNMRWSVDVALTRVEIYAT